MKRFGMSLFVLSALVLGGWGIKEAAAKGACKADVEKFCSGVQPGEGRIHQCLKQHENELSSECKAKKQAMKERHKACKADKEKFCKDIKPGEGRIKACMQAHEKELSAECRSHRPPASQS